MKSLDEMLQYENTIVVQRFLNMFDVTETIAKDIFKETLRYLYLSRVTEQKRSEGQSMPSLGITHQIMIIDEMWHAFILNTRDYMKFCEKYLDQFIHHPPQYQSKDGKPYDIHNIEAFEQKVSYIYDTLGEETVEKWFSTYGDRYGPEQLSALRI